MDVSKNRDTPKWMVYNGKPIKMDDLEVFPYFWKQRYIGMLPFSVRVGNEGLSWGSLNVNMFHDCYWEGEHPKV